MSFLAPLFLLGGLAIAGPVLFHLIRRNTREKFTFSSLMFLRADPPKVTRKSRLEDILLLLVRCALLAVMALAFSRPFIRQSVLPPHDPTAGRHVVLLVDQSASMRRTGVWEKTLAQAEATLKALKPNDTLAALAETHGGRFKSSGAGGGDVGLLFADRSAMRARLFEAFHEAGAEVLDLGFAAPGLIHETQ